MRKTGVWLQKGWAWVSFLGMLLVLFLMMTVPAFAANEMKTLVMSVLEEIIYPIFSAIGVLLGAYGFGGLVLAFKNSDPDAQARATQALVVAIALVGIRVFIGNIHLERYL